MLVLCESEVLLVRQSYGDGRWTIPGGGVRSRESAAVAARRELLEEVGIEVSHLRMIGEYHQYIEYKDDTVSCFVTSDVSGRVTIDGGEIVAAEWFPLGALPSDRRPSVDRILRMMK